MSSNRLWPPRSYRQQLEVLKRRNVMMPISHDDVMAKLSPERQERIRDRTQELLAEEEMTLRDLRVVQNLTQARMAEAMGIEQDSVSRMERRSDMLVSTISEYVEAMGGRLRIVAEFPNRRPYSVKLAPSTDSDKPRRRPHPNSNQDKQ